MIGDKGERQKYSDLFKEQGYLLHPGDLITRKEIEPDLSGSTSVQPKDQSPFRQACIRIMRKNRKCNVILLSKKQFTLGVSRSDKKLYPLLDDAAQLTGRFVRRVSSFNSIKKLSASALFVKDEGCLCIAGDFYETHALAMVIEKACGAQIASFFLGGGKPIKAHEAVLMRLIYLLKYSKKLKS